MLYSIFFTTVYISSSFIFRAVFRVISVSILFILYLPPALALNMSLLLIFKITLNLDSIVIEPGFILKAIYYYSFIG